MTTVGHLNISANTNSRVIENYNVVMTEDKAYVPILHDTQSFELPGIISHSEEMRALSI